MTSRTYCNCYEFQNSGRTIFEIKLHTEQQNTKCDAWKRLLDLVEVAAADEREEFAPNREMAQEDWDLIITLPVGATVEAGYPTKCSICKTLITASNLHQVWISLPVATDVLPLLVNACSKACIETLPIPPKNYIQKPHMGGLNIQQPPRSFVENSGC